MKIIFLLFLVFSSAVFADESLGPRIPLFRVDKLEIQGNQRVENEAILEKVDSQPGTNIDNHMLQSDLKRIFSLNFFEEVEAHSAKERGQKKLIFRVKERPAISEILFQGNKGIKEADLKEKISSKKFTIVDLDTIKNDIAELQKLYEEKGYYLAIVDYELQSSGDDTVKLIFMVKEFSKVKVKSIAFLGNKKFSDEKLKSILATKEKTPFAFLSGNGKFQEENFRIDIERLRFFYLSNGHLQIQIEKPIITVSEDRKWIFISFQLVEGDAFKLNSISLKGDLLLTEKELKEKMSLKPGETYSEEKLLKDIQTLSEYYQDQGYAFANVLRSLRPVKNEKKVDLIINFEQGELAYFGEITIKGNQITRDKVVRRQLMFQEGMKYSGSALRKSKVNINRLGYFEPGSVAINTLPPQGKKNFVNVEVLVKEKRTGQFNFSAGYSSQTSAFVQASISQNNFRGKGQRLALTATLSGVNQTYNLGLTDNFAFDTRWTLGADLFRIRNDFSNSFSYKREGFSVTSGYPLFKDDNFTKLFFTYKLEDTELRDTTDPTINSSLENGIASSLTTSLVWDRRNNAFDPNDGYYGRVSSEYAGLGGVQKWLRTDYELRYYKKIVGDLVLKSRFLAQQIFRTTERDVPRTRKFVLGGPRTMRGFDFEDIGPLVDLVDANGILRTFNRGGLFSVLNTVELEHPLVREAGLKWAVFVDAGNVFEEYIGKDSDYSLRYNWGVGLRWFSPVGVLRFEFGYPLGRKEREAGSQFHFDIGQLF